MGEITQVAIAENRQAIWDYDPGDPQSLVNGGVDVIAVIRTLIIKVSQLRPSLQSPSPMHCVKFYH